MLLMLMLNGTAVEDTLSEVPIKMGRSYHPVKNEGYCQLNVLVTHRQGRAAPRRTSLERHSTAGRCRMSTSQIVPSINQRPYYFRGWGLPMKFSVNLNGLICSGTGMCHVLVPLCSVRSVQPHLDRRKRTSVWRAGVYLHKDYSCLGAGRTGCQVRRLDEGKT